MVPNTHNSKSLNVLYTLHCKPPYKFSSIFPHLNFQTHSHFEFSNSVGLHSLFSPPPETDTTVASGESVSMAQFFRAVSILILAAVTTSMVVLPLILPPLPSPPLVLLFFPVGIMVALMLLVFGRSDAPIPVKVVV